MAACSVLLAMLTLAAVQGTGTISIEGLRWSFDGRLKEESPRHLDGRARGKLDFADSPIGGQTLRLDGKTAVMFGPSGGQLDLSSREFTVAAWIRPEMTKQAGIVSLGGYFWRQGWLLDMHGDGSLRLELSAPEGKPYATLLSGSGVIAPGRWSHVAAVVRIGAHPGPSRLYVNGFEVASKTFASVELSNPAANLTVGGIENAEWAGFPGLIDEVRLFARALDDSEIAALVEPGRAFARRPNPGPTHWQEIAPWALNVGPLDRFADRHASPVRVPFEDQKFSIRTGEVVAFTGSTNSVLEHQTGWLETLLAASAREQRPVFRPMGWEGDTVYEQWRAMNFGGWGEQFDAIGASVIVAWFGQVETLDDSKDDHAFSEAYAKLLDEFRVSTRRLVVIAPPPFEIPGSAWIPDNTRRNGRVKVFTKIARRLAQERGAVFVDLGPALDALRAKGRRLTEDGMHFTPEGLRVVAELITGRLGLTVKAGPELLEPLRVEIVAKNRLWFDCWRTMNWFFAYGDRTGTDFPKPGGGHPRLTEELEQYKDLIRIGDEEVHQFAFGNRPAFDPSSKPISAPSEPRQAPEEERKSFTLREGFDVNLFASEADGLVKPIQIDWDERGRLWALCVPSYPQLVPGVPANDYILVCEDTDGDGRADRFNRVVQGLSMPTGMALGDGGIYVCEATQLIHLRDLDGDGKFESRRVVFSGFGTGDSHQMINSPSWGPDGRLWFTQGLHIFSRVETPWGLARSGKTTIWRMDPKTLRLDPFLGNAAATENAWGVGFDDWGRAFYEPGNDPVTIYLDPALVPLPVEQLAYGQYHDIGKLARSKAKAMRVEFIGSRHLTDDLQGALVKSVYLGSQVELHRLIEDGSGFSSKLIGPLIESSSEAFRPLETRVGPDGGLYLCDWFNPIIGHYQASYRDPRRDHSHGRIWRITAKGRPLVKPPVFEAKNPRQWLGLLGDPERWTREQARRLLFAGPSKDVVKAADEWLANDGVVASPHYLAEVLGVYASNHEPRPALLRRLLDSPDPRARAVASKMIGPWADRLDDPLSLLRERVADESPMVRLEAVVSCSYVRSAAAVEVATGVLDRPRDRFIDYGLTQTIRALKPEWAPSLARGDLGLEGRPDQLRFLLEADGTKDVVDAVRKLTRTAGLELSARDRLLSLLVDVGNRDDLRSALDQGSKSVNVLRGLGRASEARRMVPSGDLLEPLKAILADRDEAIQTEGLNLVGLWGAKPLEPLILDRLKNLDTPEAIIKGALGALAAIDGRDALPILTPFVLASRSLDVRLAALEAIGRVDLEIGARYGARLMLDVEDETRMARLIQPFLGRKGGVEALGKALTHLRMTTGQATLARRVLSAAGRSAPALISALNRSLGVVDPAVGYNEALVKRLAADARSRGDAVRGRRVFESKLANCNACHRIGGQGGEFGPDLSSVGTGLKADLIIESVLWPNRQVKEGYLASRVATTDGRIVLGFKVKESPEGVELRDPTTRQIVRIARNEIDEMGEVGSLMPEGLTAGMTAKDLGDLFRFLIEQGKPSAK
jgi:putative heme-binding domain-containing protein